MVMLYQDRQNALSLGCLSRIKLAMLHTSVTNIHSDCTVLLPKRHINPNPFGQVLDCAVCDAALSCMLLQDAGQGHMIELLPKHIGFGMGLEFREAINLLNNKNDRKVAAGMIFNVAVGKQALMPSFVSLPMLQVAVPKCMFHSSKMIAHWR